jgi:hypothetical protein
LESEIETLSQALFEEVRHFSSPRVFSGRELIGSDRFYIRRIKW